MILKLGKFTKKVMRVAGITIWPSCMVKGYWIASVTPFDQLSVGGDSPQEALDNLEKKLKPNRSRI